MKRITMFFVLPFLFSHHAFAKNNLDLKHPAKNSYLVMRHGESFTNVDKRAVGSMKAGMDPKNGLTETGKVQAKEAAEKYFSEHEKYLITVMRSERLIIVSSPFSRTLETAKIFKENLERIYEEKMKVKPTAIVLRTDKDLKERGMGDYEGKNTEGLWDKVNKQDLVDPLHGIDHMESADEMETRVTSVIQKLEAKEKGKTILLVSHGDPCSMILNAVTGDPVSNFIKIPRFKNADLREIKVGK